MERQASPYSNTERQASRLRGPGGAFNPTYRFQALSPQRPGSSTDRLRSGGVGRLGPSSLRFQTRNPARTTDTK